MTCRRHGRNFWTVVINIQRYIGITVMILLSTTILSQKFHIVNKNSSFGWFLTFYTIKLIEEERKKKKTTFLRSKEKWFLYFNLFSLDFSCICINFDGNTNNGKECCIKIEYSVISQTIGFVNRFWKNIQKAFGRRKSIRADDWSALGHLHLYPAKLA